MHVLKAGRRGAFYRRTRPDGTQIDDFEATMGVLEGMAAPVLRQLVAGEPLSRQHKPVLTQFLGLQMLRGPAFVSEHDAGVDHFVPDQLTRDHVKPALLARTDGDLQLAREEVVAIFRQPTWRLLTMVTVSLKVSAVLGSMRWRLLHFQQPVVAYSDQPIVVWPSGVAAFDAPPGAPSFAPMAALEVRVPLTPHLILLMTWVDEPDVFEPADTPAVYAAESNALVIAQADKQWMHRPGSEPPVALGRIRPLSRAFETRYTAETAITSRRRATAERWLRKVQGRRFLDEIEVAVIR